MATKRNQEKKKTQKPTPKRNTFAIKNTQKLIDPNYRQYLNTIYKIGIKPQVPLTNTTNKQIFILKFDAQYKKRILRACV